MNKKGQVQAVVYGIIVVVLVGFILSWFSPLLGGMVDLAFDFVPEDSVLGRIILIGFGPVKWIFWIFLSTLVLYRIVLSSGGEV